jgi:CRP-like cAMP-binding protein
MTESKNNIYSDITALGNVDGFLDEILESIDQIKLFEGFNRDELNVLCHFMQCYAAPSDYILLEEGHEGDFLVLILTGAVRVVKTVTGHEVKQIAQVGVGGSLGELSLLDGRPRFATCITNEPTDFAVLTRSSLNEILIHYPRLANKFLLVLLQIMSERIRETTSNFLPITYDFMP